MWPEPFTIKGKRVHLVPLARDHAQDLKDAARDGALDALWYTSVPSPQTMEAEIERRLKLQETGDMVAFSVVSPINGRAVGMTTYMNIDAANRRLEIGSTWYRRAVQRTGLNTECKYHLLTKAFEGLGCIAVEFRTHFMNRQSRQAIERLGAKLDGVLRSHMVLKNGTIRDTAVYSILATEWPAVKANLEWMMRER